jgi:DNA-binding IscR family transcriptional regulator
MSQRDISSVLEVLSHRGWIVETERGWVLGKSAASIQMSDVAKAWMEDTAPDGQHQSETAVKLQKMLREGYETSMSGTLAEALERWS